MLIITEWSDGYGVRFGVTFTDYDTLERTPKRSALLLKTMFDERMSTAREHDAGPVGLNEPKPRI